MLRVALDTIASPTIRSASEYREQKFTAVTESEFRRWSKLNNADTPLLDQISSKEGTKCYMTTSVNNHMGDRDPANYYYWIDYDYPGTVRYSIETHQELFCGVTLNKLTPDQKKLYDNLSSEERTVLSQKITIDINK